MLQFGGKTGINFRGLKNRLGTFASPAGISIHTAFLDTLNAREMSNGWAEHIKHTLIASEEAAQLPWEDTMRNAQPQALKRPFFTRLASNQTLLVKTLRRLRGHERPSTLDTLQAML